MTEVSRHVVDMIDEKHALSRRRSSGEQNPKFPTSLIAHGTVPNLDLSVLYRADLSWKVATGVTEEAIDII